MNPTKEGWAGYAVNWGEIDRCVEGHADVRDGCTSCLEAKERVLACDESRGSVTALDFLAISGRA